jgi:nitroimidazol reductase NimA-like FMN-containing flavoprotein (pyridoxamine 5'-phosphate oxidase superfamily)
VSGGPAEPTRHLDGDAIEALLQRCDWGVLATAGADGPYGVPVAYGFDGIRLYFAMAAGRKAANLDRDPASCLTVVETEPGVRWASVVAEGRVEWITDPDLRMRAATAIARQWERRWGASAQDAARLAQARIGLLTPQRLTGRSWAATESPAP